MKKSILILVLCLGIHILALTPLFGQVLGDVNNSGKIDIIDALLVAQYYVGLDPPGFHVSAADVNGDGQIHIVDALLVAQYYVGLITVFPGQSVTPQPPTPTAHSCISGETKPCGSEIGACAAGVQTCVDGQWGPCTGSVEPATEVCNSIDDDCDGLIDEEDAVGCSEFYYDSDGDGFGLTGLKKCLCSPEGFYTAPVDGDCNDENPDIYPGNSELCNGVDDNCDSVIDEAGAEGCSVYYYDFDGDTFGVSSDAMCLCRAGGYYTALQGGDCDDADPGIFPDAPELCDGKDNDCDSIIDEDGALGCTPYYPDADGDGYGTGTPRCLCAPSRNYTALRGGDCNDDNTAVNPAKPEICDGIDNNCNGDIDEGVLTRFYLDADRDGYGTGSSYLDLCSAAAPFDAGNTSDCNDGDAAIYPGCPEVCDGKDNDCDSVIDEEGAQGCTPYYTDMDRDGYGTGTPRCLCAPSGNYTARTAGDCNDNNAAVNPAKPEICDGIDNNCNGDIDEGVLTRFYLDADRDGYGTGSSYQDLCSAAAPFDAGNASDCNDGDAAIYPGCPEICDGKDNDCDGTIDEGLLTRYYYDADNDTYGITTNYQDRCSASGNYRAIRGNDCNDNDATIYPGRTEVCDGKDNDCDGVIDEEGAQGCIPYYTDMDRDGYGTGTPRCLCAPSGNYTARTAGDCNDNNAAVNPARPEICDGIDNNCNGSIDEGVLKRFYYDADNDGYGITSNYQDRCSASGYYRATRGGDCSDNNASINPAATEVCDGVDNDCDGSVDEGVLKRFYYDADNDGYGVTSNYQDRCSASGYYRATRGGDCDDNNPNLTTGTSDVYVPGNGSNTITIPAGITYSKVILIAGGGGGAAGYTYTSGTNYQNCGGGGGGAGQVRVFENILKAGTTYYLTVGSGGSGGSWGGAASTGARGGDTKIATKFLGIVIWSQTAVGGNGAVGTSGGLGGGDYPAGGSSNCVYPGHYVSISPGTGGNNGYSYGYGGNGSAYNSYAAGGSGRYGAIIIQYQ